ncbi:hypothetical protein NDU88_004785 [Pleurodeles waltl]|uniref:Uncharacterized protein n=1 Tax=Pleurodeles waltl TaxID=8319 RepID=A0AAV7QFH6_PLEWA|nr:hypothetical protein NDU88_004785 [Pleurodeles waltl]
MRGLVRGCRLFQEGVDAGVGPSRSACEERASVLPSRSPRVSAATLPAQAVFQQPSGEVRLRAAEMHPEALEAEGFLTSLPIVRLARRWERCRRVNTGG